MVWEDKIAGQDQALTTLHSAYFGRYYCPGVVVLFT